MMPGLPWAAEGPTPMPNWTVPVLKLVSATRVQPVTGVVISKTGLVAIPAEFATEQDEIIVLDGGTDIVRYGRPAKIIQRFSGTGITVISVANLVRTPPALSGHEFQNGDVITLQALPPAEMIAQGADPLSVPATLTIGPTPGQPAISADTPLPNVTGALVDACGGLAGINLADGVQSLETPVYTRKVWKEQLAEIARALQVDLRLSVCSQPQQDADESTVKPVGAPPPEPVLPEEDNEQHDADEQPATDEEPVEAEPEATPDQDPDPVEPEPAPLEPVAEQIEDQAEIETTEPEILEEEEQPAAEPVEQADEGRTSGWWLIGLMLLVSAAVIIPVLRKRRRAQAIRHHEDPYHEDRSHDEPFVNPGDPESPTLDTLQSVSGPESDIQVLVVGRQPDGSVFQISRQLSRAVPELMIGRGAVDISIDNEAISREHARIGFRHSGLTLAGLGARNGTTVNGIECRAGEIFYIEPDDEIELANVTLKISMSEDLQSTSDDIAPEGSDE